MRRPLRPLAAALASILSVSACPSASVSMAEAAPYSGESSLTTTPVASVTESAPADAPEGERANDERSSGVIASGPRRGDLAGRAEEKPSEPREARAPATPSPVNMASPTPPPPMTKPAGGAIMLDEKLGRPSPRDRTVAHDLASDPEGRFQEGGEFVATGTNPLVDPNIDALSTFAIDVDTGSYTLSRRYLENGSMPAAQGVRVEEWVNAFHYSYPDTSAEHPFSIHVEGAPLAKRSYVMRVGIQGKRVEKAERAPVHLTFLADVSGSMSGADRLPLAKKALGLLVNELGPKDSVSLVTYAGSTRVVLGSTPVTQGNRAKIIAAIDDLKNGGGTAMGSGMELAYREATKALGDKGISRVIVLSDGDANLGATSHEAMLASIKGYVSEGVTMSTIGFGTGNYRDNLMEQLADAGNGNYSYVGSMKDAKKIFVDDLTGTLQVIAKDTKIQVEMNKDVVESYRLIGYENRDIADRDFRNDKVDAGEIGAGHTVTALYEVNLKSDDVTSDIATVRVRYKQPRGEKATEVSARFPASAMKQTVAQMSADGRYATGIALTAEVFRHSEHMSRLGIGLDDAHELLVSGAVGPFAEERRELVRLIGPLAAGAAVAKR